jgi:hypothetical protein
VIGYIWFAAAAGILVWQYWVATRPARNARRRRALRIVTDL